LESDEKIKDEVSFQIYQNAFQSLVRKVSEFGEVYLKNIKLTKDIAQELNYYDNCIKNCPREAKKIENGKELAESGRLYESSIRGLICVPCSKLTAVSEVYLILSH